jgi:hypothetical protein
LPERGTSDSINCSKLVDLPVAGFSAAVKHGAGRGLGDIADRQIPRVCKRRQTPSAAPRVAANGSGIVCVLLMKLSGVSQGPCSVARTR